MTRETILSLLDHPAVERVGWTLLHFLWEGAAVAAVLVGGLWLLRRRSPQARYAAACGALAALTLLPCVTFLALGGNESGRAAAPGRSTTRTPAGAVYLGPVPADAVAEAQDAASRGADPAPDVAAVSWVASVWAAGVVALACWQVGGWLHLRRRLARETRTVGGAVRGVLDELAAALRVSRPVRLAEAAWVQVPAVVGALRPVVLLPAGALTGLPPAQLRALLAHELAHVRRHDYAVNLLQTLLQTLLFYHPAVWWVSARMREEREYCCDEVAAGASGDRVAYARALTAMEELRALPIGLALAARGGVLLRRVERLLGVERAAVPAHGGRRSVVGAALAVVCVAVPLAAARIGAAPAADQPSTQPTRPTTEPAAAETPESPVKPEDLLVEAEDYRIQANDLLTVEIDGLTGPDKATVKTARVTQSGSISLPLVGQVNVAGLTEAAAEQLIPKVYKDQNILERAQVSVTVVEARGQAFGIVGDVGKPGRYSIREPDFRLLDALAIAEVGPKAATGLFVLRGAPEGKAKAGEAPPEARKIRVPVERLAEGDPKVNLVIRPGDLIMVQGAPPPKSATLTIGPGTLSFQGKATNWEELPALLEAVPEADRRRTTLRLSAASDDLTLRQYHEARGRAAALAKRLGFAGTVDDVFDNAGGGGGANPEPGPRGDGAPVGPAVGPAVGREYFVGGQVERPGAYTLGGRAISVRQALIAAGVGGDLDAFSHVRVVRNAGAGDPPEVVQIEATPLLEAGRNDQPVRSGDQLTIVKKKASGE